MVNTTQTPAQVYPTGVSVDKADVIRFENEIKAGFANSGKTFVSRAAAVSAGQDALPSSLGQIETREGDYLVKRSPTAFADDPLFETNPRWGVVQRLPSSSLLDAEAQAREAALTAEAEARDQAIASEMEARSRLISEGVDESKLEFIDADGFLQEFSLSRNGLEFPEFDLRPWGADGFFIQDQEYFVISQVGESLSPQPTDAVPKDVVAYRAKTAQIRAGVAGATARIVITGDSWTEWRNILSRPLSEILWEKYGQAGTGWISLYADENGEQSQLLGDARLVREGNWSRRDMDPDLSRGIDGYAFQTSDQAATVTMTAIRGDRIRWFYLDGSQSWQYSLDGAAPITVAGDGTGQIRTLDLSGLSGSAHSLTITHAGIAGMVTHYGGYATLSAGGIEVSKAGNGGTYGAQWETMAPHIGPVAGVISPDLVMIMLGTNDARLGRSADEYEAGIRALITAWRSANPRVDVALLLPMESGQAIGSPLYRQYLQKLRMIEATVQGVHVIDLYSRLPGYSATAALGLWQNNLHPNLAGGFVNADTVAHHLNL